MGRKRFDHDLVVDPYLRHIRRQTLILTAIAVLLAGVLYLISWAGLFAIPAPLP